MEKCSAVNNRPTGQKPSAFKAIFDNWNPNVSSWVVQRGERRARCAKKFVLDNGGILLVNPQVPKIVPRTCFP